MIKLLSQKETQNFRRLLAIAGVIYIVWWLAVEMLFPQSFNPLLGRTLVGLACFSVLGLSFVSPWVLRKLGLLLLACLWVLTLHYYYLFYKNGGDINWMIGCFITIAAINFCFFSNASLLAYSGFVLTLSLAIMVILPALQQSVFLPGVITILLQANIGGRARLNLIKDLAETNERFQLLFDSAFEGILLHESGAVVNVNGALASLTGYSRKELVGMSVMDIIHPDEREGLAKKMKQPEVLPYETRLRKKNGATIDVEVRAKNIRYENTNARLVTVLDLADRKKAQQEKYLAMTLAENVRVRDEFISIASHELKTPLAALKLQTLMIERDVKKNVTETYTPVFLNELLLMFNTQVDRLTELVDSLLDVSKISAGQLKLTFENVDLADLLNDSINNLHIQGRVVAHSPRHLPISGDGARLRQVIENLLKNAVKYGEGKPVSVKLESQASLAVLTVEDHGRGIEPEQLKRIFDRFERAIPAKNISGFGLGLYVSKEIVQAHGGFISVDSKLGQGAKFTVRLPMNSR